MNNPAWNWQDPTLKFWLNRRGDRLAGSFSPLPESDWGKNAVFQAGSDAPWVITGEGTFRCEFDISPYLMDPASLGDNQTFSYSHEGGGAYTFILETSDEFGSIVEYEMNYINLDLDEDGWPDSVELSAGSDPLDEFSFPGVRSGDSSAIHLSDCNDLGDVVGWSTRESDLIYDPSTTASDPFPANRGFLWQYRDMSITGVTGQESESQFHAINNSGHILVRRVDYVPETEPYDSDGDGVDDTEIETGYLNGEISWAVLVPDNDGNGNGLPDDWEELSGVSDPEDDSIDYDGWSARNEYILGTDPHASDSDGDGIEDEIELAYGRNPHFVEDPEEDVDGDGLGWAQEMFQPWEQDPVTGEIVDNPPQVVEKVTLEKSTPYTLDLTTGGKNGMEYLLPVEIVDINSNNQSETSSVPTTDEYTPTTQSGGTTIQPWDTAQPITEANIAWIEAHTSDEDSAPRMPRLEFRIPNFPNNVTLEAKLLVEYERPYAGKQAEDTVKVPADGSFQSITNGTWRIWQDYQDLPFFGGNAKIIYKIDNGAEQTINFAIGGRNPDDDRCKQFVQSRNGAPWYAYAIIKHESQAYNPGFYNQFWERNGNSSPINGGINYEFTIGDPLKVLSPGEEGVGGTGLAQVTGAGGNKVNPASREIFWNWQRNVDAFLAILAQKIQLAETFMNDSNPRSETNPMPNGQRPQTAHHTGQNVPVPSRQQANVTFGDNEGEKRPEDAVAIKAYNGATAHWCSWRGPAVHEWQWNYGQNNYVQRVCEQVEDEEETE